MIVVVVGCYGDRCSSSWRRRRGSVMYCDGLRGAWSAQPRRRHINARTSSASCPAELFGVVLRAQSGVDVVDVTLQDVFERRAEVAVEAGVDDGVEEAVCVAEPQEDAAQPVRDTLGRVVAERFDQRQDEEWQPAGAERSHDDAERLGRFALVRRRYSVQSRLTEQAEATSVLGVGG